jgi:hypothetical protein
MILVFAIQHLTRLTSLLWILTYGTSITITITVYNLRLFSHSIHHYTFRRYLVNLFLSEPLVDMTEFLTEFKQLLVCHGVGVGVLGVPLALLNGSFNRDLLFYLGVMHLHHHLMQKFFLTPPMPIRSLLFFLLHLQSDLEGNLILIS